MVVTGQSGGIMVKRVVIRAKMVVFGHSGCLWAKGLYSGKSGCIRT